MTRRFLVACLALVAATIGSTADAQPDRATWGVKLQPDTPGVTTPYAVYFNRESTRDYYKKVFLIARRKADPAGGDDLSEADKNAIRQMIRDDLQMVIDALTKSTAMFRAWGCKEAALKPVVEENGKTYLPVFLEDFGVDQRRVAGKAELTWRADGTPGQYSVLKLNVFAFARKRVDVGHTRAMAATTAHELFHTIQWAYVPLGDYWLKESTATWAANQVVHPALTHAGHMDLYILNMHRPLTYDDRAPGAMAYSTLDTDGRPYGAGIFFHFLSRQLPDGKKLVIDTFEKYAGGAPTAVAAISKALGDGESMGPRFRELFDRFAVGALLTDGAPDDCKLIEGNVFQGSYIERARRNKVNLTNPRNLTPVFDRFYSSEFRSPETASLVVDFHAGANQVAGRKFTLTARNGEVAGCASRYFLFKKPQAAPDSASLDAVVKAGEKDISLQAVWSDGAAWKVIKGAYTADAAGHTVRVPVGRSKDGQVFLIVTRYAEDERLTTFPMSLAIADPPTLKRVEVTQKSNSVIKAEWTPQLSPAGEVLSRLPAKTGTGKLDVKNGDAIVRIEFTSPVKAGVKPICAFGGRELVVTSTANDTVFEGAIPSAWFSDSKKDYALTINARANLSAANVDLPLDAEPATVARLKPDLSDWVHYERDRGVELTLRPSRPIDFQFTSVQWKDLKTYNGKQLTLIYGEVKNIGDVAATNPIFQLKGSSFNKLRFPLGTGLRGPYNLPPGGSAPFTLVVEPDNKKDSYEFAPDPINLHPVDHPVSDTGLKLGEFAMKFSWDSQYVPIQPTVEVSCKLLNPTDKPIAKGSEAFCITFYDAAGKIIGGGGDSRSTEGMPAGQMGYPLSLRIVLLSREVASYQLTISAADMKIMRVLKSPAGGIGLNIEGTGQKADDKTIQLTGTIRNTGQAPFQAMWPVFISRQEQPNQPLRVHDWRYFEADAKPIGPGGAYTYTRPFSAEQVGRMETVLPGGEVRPKLE